MNSSNTEAEGPHRFGRVRRQGWRSETDGAPRPGVPGRPPPIAACVLCTLGVMVTHGLHAC